MCRMSVMSVFFICPFHSRCLSVCLCVCVGGGGRVVWGSRYSGGSWSRGGGMLRRETLQYLYKQSVERLLQIDGMGRVETCNGTHTHAHTHTSFQLNHLWLECKNVLRYNDDTIRIIPLWDGCYSDKMITSAVILWYIFVLLCGMSQKQSIRIQLKLCHSTAGFV